MEGFPREFLPSKGHQTLKDVQIPIPISNNQSVRDQPYTFEFMYNSVDSPFIDFSNSYLELWFNVISDGGVVIQKESCNLYSIIDKITIDMMYVSPAGQDISVNYSESSIESSKARKFVILKELSKDEIDKSMYASFETLYSPEIKTMRYLEKMGKNSGSTSVAVQVFIPLMLITGLGTFDCAIKVKTLKMQFVTSYLKNLIHTDHQKTVSTQFTEFKLNKVYMNFRQIYDINFGNDPKALIKCIPNNCQVATYNTLVATGTAVKNSFLVNRSVNFIPDYAMLYFTNEMNSMIPINTETVSTIQFQIGGQNIYSKTDFPPCKIFKEVSSAMKYKLIPNTMFYNTWRSNSNPQSPLNGIEWYNQPIYLFPISSVVDVNTRSGCEVNIQFTSEYIGGDFDNTGTIPEKDTDSRNIYAHFIFVKFVRDGAMN